MTSSERWALVSDLFGRAMALPADRRNAFLDAECDGDPSLRTEVASLIDSAPSAEGYLEDLARRAGLPTSPDTRLERFAGKRLGPWRLDRLVGQGGMGAVYLAERDDGQLEMRAALKLLRVGAVSEDAHQRFLAERQILARLQHPNIARLLDGGVTGDGTPYYVMEYIDGLPIDRYCDGRRLTVTERIELFLQVCAAVAHAHRNLVVHRDLKPGNILVTDAGEVKLLDFGIARMLEPSETLRDASAVYGHPMTVAYASPEQLRGGDITTATDVYALGLLLYELLAGAHPYRHGLTSSVEAERLICETPVSTPSHTVSRLLSRKPRAGGAPSAEAVADARQVPPERLARLLTGDLDTIVLMALRKEPDRRYQSAADLGDDLRRYLQRRPVSAQPDTVAYRARRFAQRNRLAVTTGAVVAVLLVALVVLSVRTAIVTSRQAAALEREARTTAEVSGFLVDLFRQADPVAGYGDSVRARTLLDEGSRRLRERLGSQPGVRARLSTTLADVYASLGLYDAAQDVAREAVSAAREEHGGDHPDVAEAIANLASHFKSDRVPDSAIVYYGQALDMQRALGTDPLGLARALTGLAGALRDAGRADSAVPLLEQAVAAHREVGGVASLNALNTLAELAMTMRALERLDSAEAIYHRLLESLPARGDSGLNLTAATLNNLAFLHRSRNDLVGADSLYHAALAVERRLGNTTNLLTVLVNMAGIAHMRGDSVETRILLEERITIARERWPGGHWRTGSALNALAIHYTRDRNDCASAVPLLEEQTDLYQRTLGPDHRWTAAAWAGLGDCLRRDKRYEEAEQALLNALDRQRRTVGLAHRETQATLESLVALFEAWGRAGRAREFRALLGS